MTEAERKEFREKLKILSLEGEKPITIGAGVKSDYFPMDDYKGNDYEAFYERKCHFCRSCIDYYQELHIKGVTEREFMPACKGDLRQSIPTANDGSFSEEEFDLVKVLADPVAWAKYEFGWDARWYQKEILRCSSQFKAIRAGRRVGKTASMSIYALWKLFTNGGITDRQFEILVLAPYQPQVAKIFDNFRDLIGRSTTMSLPGVIERDVQNPQMIQFADAGVARGWSAGSHSGAKSDKVRGQDADMIVLDEVDYIADTDIEVIMAILASHPTCELIVSSTPTGIRKKLHGWCTNKNQGFKEFWYISQESPNWNAQTEKVIKDLYCESTFAREFLAEFGEEMEGVFKSSDINRCLANYEYTDCTYHSECKYVIGVDWNKVTGTHIVVIELSDSSSLGVSYRIVDLDIIRKLEFSQHAAVEAVMAMDKKWGGNTFMYVDRGYGEVQVEMLWKYDVDYPSEKTNYKERVVPITMNQSILIKDPATKQDIKKPIKQFMVNCAQRALEQNLCIMPQSEDTDTRIIPTELPYSDIGLVQQMRGFKITKWSPSGVPSYSQEYEHTLTAWMLAILGHNMQHTDIGRVDHVHNIGYTSGIGSEHGLSTDDAFDLNKAKDLAVAQEAGRKHAQLLAPSQRASSVEELSTSQTDAGSSIAAHIVGMNSNSFSRAGALGGDKRDIGSQKRRGRSSF